MVSRMTSVKRFFRSTVAGALLAVATHAANAAPINFVISSATATPYGVSVGSTVSVTSLVPNNMSFTLDNVAGPSSTTFDFLHVDVTGIGAVAGYIDAALNFSSPVTNTAGGVLGGFAVILGIGSTGMLTVLNDPGPIAFDGGWFDVDFIGFSTSCVLCNHIAGNVQAKVTLTSVPEPGTVSLLGAGLLALALAGRRRKRA